MPSMTCWSTCPPLARVPEPGAAYPEVGIVESIAPIHENSSSDDELIAAEKEKATREVRAFSFAWRARHGSDFFFFFFFL